MVEQPNQAKPIVIDIGSSTVKVGFAGDKLPKKVFPAVVRRPMLLPGDSKNKDDCIVLDFDEEDSRSSFEYS